MADHPGERSHPYDTTEPEGLGSVISALFALKGYGRSQGDKRLHDLWRQAVDAETLAETQVLSLRGGVLLVAVGNSALLGELTAFRKFDLLAQIQAKAEGIRIKDLKFKLRGGLKKR